MRNKTWGSKEHSSKDLDAADTREMYKRDIEKKSQMEIFFFTNFETFEMTTMVKLKNVENAGERQLCIMDIYMENAGKRLSQFLANKNIIFPNEYCE